MAAMPRPGSSGSTPAVNEAALELEGLAMAGLVAVLRHLGDLAELAAEVFDGLQDQAVAVSARARRLKARAKQLQADLDRNGHRHLLCQAQTTRTLTRRQQQQQKVSHGVVSVAGGEAPPSSIVNHIKRCRGPPRLSALDRFDAHGDGACLKRYTDPSFFRVAHSQNVCFANHLHQADSDDTRSQTDDSEKHSLGFLSMLRRQLKHRQTAGSVSSPSLKLQTCTHKSSHSDVEMDKANRNHPSTTGQSKDSPTSNFCSDAAAGSDYVGSCSELQRTSSFEAWLSPGPGARFGSADPAVQDSAAVSDDALLKDSHQETTRLQRTGCESYDDDDAPADPEKHDKQNGPSISSQCSNSSSPENSGEHTYTPDAKDVVLLPRMQRTECETDKSLHTKLTSVLPENINSSKADAPPLLPIPPMQWLSAKVHTGKDHVQRAGGKILKNTELSVLELTSGWSEPGGTNQLSGAEIRSQLAAADTDRGMEVTDRPTQDLYREGAEMSSCGKANKAQAQVDVQSSGDENVFFSAVEQLARTSPPWIPSRCDRITLRNGPSPLHGSRSILDCRTTLLEQIKDKAHADSNHVHSD